MKHTYISIVHTNNEEGAASASAVCNQIPELRVGWILCQVVHALCVCVYMLTQNIGHIRDIMEINRDKLRA